MVSNGDITISVLGITGKTVRLGVSALGIPVHRKEVHHRIIQAPTAKPALNQGSARLMTSSRVLGRAKDVMNLVLITQYFDTLKEIGASSRSNTMLFALARQSNHPERADSQRHDRGQPDGRGGQG